MGSRCGQMVLDMKASGTRIKLTAKESSIMWTVTYLTACGRMTKQMDTAHTTTQTDPNMRACGLMTCKTDKARRPGKTNLLMRASTVRDKSMGVDFTFGKMALSMKVTGLTTKYKDKVNTAGLMAEFT